MQEDLSLSQAYKYVFLFYSYSVSFIQLCVMVEWLGVGGGAGGRSAYVPFFITLHCYSATANQVNHKEANQPISMQ